MAAVADPKLPVHCAGFCPTKQGAVRAVRFNVDGNYCLVCGSNKTIQLWNPHKSILLKTYTGHGYEVLDADCSSDSGQLCSCSLDKTVILWDVAEAKVLRKYREHAGRVNSCCFNEDSSLVLSGSLDGTARIWDCRSRRLEAVQVLDDAKDSVTSVRVSAEEVLTGSADGCVRRYDVRMGQLHQDYIGKPVTSVNFTKDGQCILVSSLDSTLRLFDKETGQLLNQFSGHRNVDYKIDNCLSASDEHVLSGSEDGRVYIWDLVQASVVKSLRHHKEQKSGAGVVHSLSFHPTLACLLTASEDRIYLWVDSPDSA